MSIRLNTDDLTVTSFATSPIQPGVPTAMPAGTGGEEVEVVKPDDTLYSGCTAQTCPTGLGSVCCV